MNRPRALVIGAGIAGPALAIFLERAGIEPAVFEAYPRTDDVGGTFQIAPNGVRVLAELGLLDALWREGQPSGSFRFRNHRGETIACMHTDRSGPALNIARAPLQRVLRDEVERRKISTSYNRRLSAVSQVGREVVAEFDDGSTDVGDFLVGADGVGSRVRSLLMPEHAQARYTGMMAVGGFCHADYAPPPGLAKDDELGFMVGPTHQIGYGKFGASLWAWWCHVLAESAEVRAAFGRLSTHEVVARMTERYDGWSDPVRDLITNTRDTLATPIFDVPHLPRWSVGRVTLMGDAAHAMSPAGGQGASMALNDAMLLARVVEQEPSVEDAFKRFETLRRKTAEAFVKQGYANDRRSLHESGPLGMWLRDHLLMPIFAPLMGRMLEKHYAAPLGA